MKKSETISTAIQAVSQEVTSKINIRESLNKIAKKAKGFLECDSCTIWLYDEDRDQLILRGASGRAEIGIDEYHYKKDEGLYWHIFEDQKSYKLKKASDAGYVWKGKSVSKIYVNGERDNTGGPFLGVPIIYRNKCIGALSFAADDLNYEFTNENLDFAQIIADEIALVLDDIDTYFENQQLISLRKEKLAFLSNFSRQLMNCKSLEDIYKLTTETTMKRLNCRTSSIFLFSKEGKLERKYIAGLGGFELPLEVYERGQGFTGKTAGTPSEYGEPHICNNFKEEEYIKRSSIIKKYVENYEIAIKKRYGSDEEIRNVVTIPLNGANRTFGVLRIINKLDSTRDKVSEKGITELDKEWLILISNVVATAVANIKKQIKSDSVGRINELLIEKKEEEIFNSLADIITSGTTSFSACIIRTLDEKGDHLIISGASGVPVKKGELTINIGQGVVGRTFLSDNYEVVSDLEKNPKGYVNIEWARKSKLISMICIPLKRMKDINFGTISVYTKYKYIFDQIDIEYLSSFAKQVSNVIQIIQEKRELRLINEISEQINQKDNILGILDTAVYEIPNITGFDVCVIVKQEHDIYCIIASSHKGLVGFQISDNNPLILAMKAKPQIMVFRDIEKKNKFEEFRIMLKDMESIILIPIITGNKKLYATIVLVKLARKEIKTEKGSKSTTYASMITQLNQNLYQALANQIAVAVDRNILLESIRIERDRKEIANEIIRQISSDEDLHNSLKTTLNKIVKILKADVGYIALLSKHTKVVEPTCLFGIKENNFPYLEVGDESITGWVYNNKETYLWPSWKKKIDSLNVPFKYLEKGVETEIIAPLLYGSEVIGFIEVASKREKAFYEEDKIFMESLADQVAVIIQNRKFNIATEMLAEIHFDEKDVQKNCAILAENADEILENSTTCVFLKKKKMGKNVLVMESCHGAQIRNNDEYDMLEGEGGISWQTVENKSEKIITEDLRNPKHGFKHIDFIIENSLESMISVPLIVVSEVIGVLNSYSRRSYKFLDKEVYLLKSLAAKGAIAIKNAELTKQIEEVSEKILDSAQLANPGQVAMSFTHDAKHTMHNINALISSLIYFLPDKIRETANVRNVIDSITNDTDYLRKLFNSLVRYAKKTDIHYKPTKLREIIEYILYIYQIRLTRNNIRCQVRYGDKELEEVYIECDRSQIEQVFLNLFNNSVYAIREKMTKGGLISIFIRALDGNYIEIQFRDNGIGIFPMDIEYVFEPFFTKKGDKGSGFGLSICKRIIEDNHFGEISIKSEYNKYTTIFIKLEQIKLEHNI